MFKEEKMLDFLDIYMSNVNQKQGKEINSFSFVF